MIACILDNYKSGSKELECFKFNNAERFKSVDTLISAVTILLKKRPLLFSALTQEESAEPGPAFIQSRIRFAYDLADMYFGKGDKKGYIEEKDFKTLTSKLKLQFREHLIKKLVPDDKVPRGIGEELSYFVIEGDGIVTTDQILKQRMDDVKKEIYGSSVEYLDLLRQARFWAATVHGLIINTNPDTLKGETWIPLNDYDINKFIIAYQNEQYRILYKYLENKGVELTGISDHMYTMESRNSTWRNLMTVAYNYIQKQRRSKEDNPTFYKKMVERQMNIQKAKTSAYNPDTNYYNFISAFINLEYFDQHIQEAFNGLIDIDRDVSEPISGNKYRYKRHRGNKRNVTKWGTEELVNATDRMSKFREVIMSSVQVWDYNSDTETAVTLRPSDVTTSFAKLNNIGKLITGLDLRDVNKSAKWFLKEGTMGNHSTSESIAYIFHALFEYDNNVELMKFLSEKGFTTGMLNTLYSLYKTCYKLPRSAKSIRESLRNESAIKDGKDITTTKNGKQVIIKFLDYVYDTYFSDLDKFNKDEIQYDKQLNTELKDAIIKVYKSLKLPLGEKNHSYGAIQDYYRRLPGGINDKSYDIGAVIDNIVTSTVEVLYLMSVQLPNGEIETSVKKSAKWSSIVSEKISTLNKLVKSDSRNNKELVTKYLPSNNIDSQGSFKLTIGGLLSGVTYTIKPNNNNAHILGKYGDSAKMGCNEVELFSRRMINRRKNDKFINLGNEKVRKNLELGSYDNDNERHFMELVKFIDDMLGTSFSTDLRLLHAYMLASNYDLESLFILAARALEIANIYSLFENSTEKKKDSTDFEKTHKIGFFEWYKEMVVQKKNPYHINMDVDPQVHKAYFQEKGNYNGSQLYLVEVGNDVILNIASAEMLIHYTQAESTVFDQEGNRRPNGVLHQVGAVINSTVMGIQRSDIDPRRYLWICQGDRHNAIERSVLNTQIMLRNGTVQHVKELSDADLMWDSITDKFIVPLAYASLNRQDFRMFVQPMTYSDKTSLFMYQINLNRLSLNNFKEADYSDKVEDIICDSLNRTYILLYNKVMTDLKTVLFYKSNKDINNISDQDVINELKNIDQNKNGLSAKDEIFRRAAEYNKDHPNTLKNPNAQIKIVENLHFRIYGGKANINETLQRYSKGYFKKEHFKKYLKRQRLEFINTLIRLNIDFRRLVGGLLDEVCDLFGVDKSSYSKSNPNGWFIGNLMILAKVRKNVTDANGNTVNTVVRYALYDNIVVNEAQGEYIELNPILEKYFVLQNLFQSQLRFALVGTEIHHDVSEYKSIMENIRKQLYDPMNGINLINESDLPGFSLVDLQAKIESETDSSRKALMQKIYDEAIDLLINAEISALSKRNIVVPATIDPYNASYIRGVPLKMNIAVIDDMTAPVFNYMADRANLKVHDGGVIATAFTMKMMNDSLLDNETGNVQKPLWHCVDDATGATALMKCAIFEMSNYKIRQSLGNGWGDGMDLDVVLKKMTDVRWHTDYTNPSSWLDGEIDLVNGCAFRGNPKKDANGNDITDLYLNPVLDGKIDFKQDITEDNSLMYKLNDGTYIIQDFGKENDTDNNIVYYTLERKIGSKESAYKVYHYFNKDGEHIRSKKRLGQIYSKVSLYHTIDSIYELHKAMGGIWSCHWDNETGLYEYDESSNRAVSNFITLVARPAKGKNTYLSTVDQDYYYQPLKHMLVHLLSNGTAMKSFRANTNPISSYNNGKVFSYMTISTKHFGDVLDPSHAADLALMTEFSLVVAELDSSGVYHDLATEVYEMLGLTALECADVELEAWREYVYGNPNDNSRDNAIYEVVGRVILQSMRSIQDGRNGEGLNVSLMNAIRKKFSINKDHSQDELFIPFSDPNIFSTMLSSFVAVINKKSIKRKYSGVGAIMVPSYNMSMIYEVDGKIYQFQDLLKKAVKDNVTVENFDLIIGDNKKNQALVQAYLQDKLNKLITDTEQAILSGKITRDAIVEKFMPTDLVLIRMTVDGLQLDIHIDLNSEIDYFAFKDAYNSNNYFQMIQFLYNIGKIKDKNINVTDIKYYTDVTRPRNLAPLKIQWSYIKDGQTHYMNIFDHWRFRGMYKDINNVRENVDLNKKQKHELIQQIRAKYDLHKVLELIDKGICYLTEEDEKNNNDYKIVFLRNDATELLLSNIYASKFGLSPNESLADALENHAAIDVNKIKFATSKAPYDIAFIKNNNRHVYITFKPVDSRAEYAAMDVVVSDFKHTFNETESRDNQYHVYSRLYKVDDNNRKEFEVGREIYRYDIEYDDTQKKFINKKNRAVINNTDQRFRKLKNGCVVERVFYIKRYRTNIGSGPRILYYIDREAASRILEMKKPNEEELKKYEGKENEYYKYTTNVNVSNLIGHAYAEIYLKGDYSGMMINSRLSILSYHIVKNTLTSFINKVQDTEPDLAKYVIGLHSTLNKLKETVKEIKDDKTVDIPFNIQDTKNYIKMHSKEREVSFQKSLYFTSARIPAQALQSFMQMKCVGYTGTDNAQAMVSHWLLWLLGSD